MTLRSLGQVVGKILSSFSLFDRYSPTQAVFNTCELEERNSWSRTVEDN